jgi:hypothetical protein
MARLISEDLDRPPSFRRWLAIRWHRMLCTWCDRYYRDLHLMRDACIEFHLHLDEGSGEILPEEKKAAMKAALRCELE